MAHSCPGHASGRVTPNAGQQQLSLLERQEPTWERLRGRSETFDCRCPREEAQLASGRGCQGQKE